MHPDLLLLLVCSFGSLCFGYTLRDAVFRRTKK